MNRRMDSLIRPLAILALATILSTPSTRAADDAPRLPEPARAGDFVEPAPELVTLGQALFFDKELSGNRNVSCATCHSPVIATVDGLSINLGTGGRGLGPLRDPGADPPTALEPQSRGSRNMTPLFNLGHRQFDTLFWDGRVQADDSMPQGFTTPAGADLPFGFGRALDALSIFAETDLQEMTGQPGTNELADASLISRTAIWDALIARLGAIPEYVELFTSAYPEVAGDPGRMTIVQLGAALGAFQSVAFRSDASPFDRSLRGDRQALSAAARRGMSLFYGRAGCSTCHSGVFQTDHDFHAIGMPQVGPGFGDGLDGREDFGREGVTGDPADRYRFRTPSLRNVALTGPWGHDGFFDSLEAVVRHHLDPWSSLAEADPSQLVLPPRPDLDALDLVAFDDPFVTEAIAAAIEIAPAELTERDIESLLDFLQALTDPSAQDLRKTIPTHVPSGLPLAEIR